MAKSSGKAPKLDAMLRAELRAATPKRTKTPKTPKAMFSRLDSLKWPR